MAFAVLSPRSLSVASHGLARKRVPKYGTVKVAVACTMLVLVCSYVSPSVSPSAFATVSPLYVMKGPQTVSRTEAPTRKDQEVKDKQNSTSYNATLQLGSGFPDITIPVVNQGPRWTTCFVAAHEPSRDVLEEWVVPAERERVDAFKTWRQQHGSQAVSVRCAPRAADATYSVQCLQCVSGTASPWSVQGRVDEVNSQSIMTFTGLHACMGFCKSGVVTMKA